MGSCLNIREHLPKVTRCTAGGMNSIADTFQEFLRERMRAFRICDLLSEMFRLVLDARIVGLLVLLRFRRHG